MHDGQLDVTTDLAVRLVRSQFPQWAELPMTAVTSGGTVHRVFRLGSALSARLPLVAVDPEDSRVRLWEHVATVRELIGRTRFPTPVPVAVGRPGEGYPMPWLVQTWIPGTVATPDDPAGSVDFAADLAEFISDVRALDTAGRRFAGGGRGGVLGTHDGWVQDCLHHSEELLDTAMLRRSWVAMRDLPRGAAPDVMSHGDLVPGNVLVAGGRLAGVIDLDAMGPADPALDLVSAWHLLDERPRRVLREALGCDDLTWARGRAWAFEQALGLVWYYASSHPSMSALGRRTLQRVTDDRDAL